MSVITIPLAPVVAFLRKRGALSVLEGAPWLTPDGTLDAITGGVHLDQRCEAPDFDQQRLYLGTDAICPAAEGWASRVLAMARNLKPSGYALSIAVQPPFTGIELWPMGWEEPECQWDWNRHMNVIDDGGRYVTFPGDAPAAPAARLAAVLLYELERA